VFGFGPAQRVVVSEQGTGLAASAGAVQVGDDVIRKQLVAWEEPLPANAGELASCLIADSVGPESRPIVVLPIPSVTEAELIHDSG
jgi:hypothetical protein